MSDKSTLIKGFNTHFFDFLDDVAGIIDNNSDILSSKVFFETIKKANPTIIIKYWYTHVYLPYKDIIDSGDIDFFINKDYILDISKLKNYEQIVKGINNIKISIKKTSKVNQEHSMKYVQNLSKISLMYQGIIGSSD
jgi:hypothetical protein